MLLLAAAVIAAALAACGEDRDAGRTGGEERAASSGEGEGTQRGRAGERAATRAARATATPVADTPVGPTGPPTATRVTTITPTRSPAAPPFEIATTITRVDAPPNSPPVTLTAVRHSRQNGYERVTFSFRDNEIPAGYEVRQFPVAYECGVGAPVEGLPGASLLIVRFEPAVAHDGARATAPGTVAGGDVILAGRQTCDRDELVHCVMGTYGVRPYRVVVLDNPPRLAIDVAE